MIAPPAPASHKDRPLLPSPLRRWPVVLRVGGEAHSAGTVAAALARIRAGMLFWPACRAGATRPRALALSPGALAAARAAYPDSDVALARDLADIDPERLEAVFGAQGSRTLWARIGGLAAPGDEDLAALLAAATGASPWTGEPLGLSDAIEAQLLLREAAMSARGPVRLANMSRWKRRCLTPFLTGPDGPPRPARPGAGGRTAVWGAEAPEGALRIEDGFLRSVGLGLRHTPPLSLVIAAAPPHFDATRPNAFEATVDSAAFSPALLRRAARLREAIIRLGLTKYNLAGGDPLPDAGGREAVLVPGQVATDASIRLGARTVRTDLELLAAARARFPDGFLLYKPHPDVVTGLRTGAAPLADARRFADTIILRADPALCLAWADRIATITSLTGFEALLRGKAVSCFGRPFYAGWGLTDDADPPPRRRVLTLDELTAAALVLHPRYVDPGTRLPCPPEVAVAALARQRADTARPAARLVRLLRDATSWAFNRF